MHLFTKREKISAILSSSTKPHPAGIFGWRFLFLACSIDFILPAGYRDDRGPLYNHKTSHNTTTKIATNNVFIISNN